MRAAVLVLTLLFALACASTPETSTPDSEASSTRAATHAPPRGVRIAQLRYDPPPDPFIDLGPVFVEGPGDRDALQQRLQIEADRLDADGFIVEGESLEAIYLVRSSWPWAVPAVSERHEDTLGAADPRRVNSPADDPAGGLLLAAIIVGVELLTEGEVKGPHLEETGSAYLRAYRLKSRGNDKRALDLAAFDIDPEVIASFKEAQSLEEQISTLNAALVAGRLDVKIYRKVRKALLS